MHLTRALRNVSLRLTPHQPPPARFASRQKEEATPISPPALLRSQHEMRLFLPVSLSLSLSLSLCFFLVFLQRLHAQMKRQEEKLKQLQSYGYSKTKSAQALKDAGNNVDVALAILKRQRGQPSTPPSATPVRPNQAGRAVEVVNTPPREKKHPCIVQHKKCRYGDSCLLRDYPGDVCINHFFGSCAFGSACWKRHYVDGVDIRAAQRPEPRDETMRLQTGVILKLDRVSGNHLLVGRPVGRAEAEAAAAAAAAALAVEPPPPSRFNLIQGSEPTHTDPRPLEWQRQSTLLAAAVQAPRPFLEAVRKQPPEQCKTPSPPLPPQRLKLPPAYSDAASAARTGKHPCIFQMGSCKYGKNCMHADRDEDVCVYFLNNCCNRGAACPYRHESNAEFVRRAKPQLFGSASPGESPSRVIVMRPGETTQGAYVDLLRQQQQQQQQHEGGATFEQRQPVHLSSFLPDLGPGDDNDEEEDGLCGGGEPQTPPEGHGGLLGDRELGALMSLLEAFPSTEPLLVLHALRSANGDSNLAADTLSKLNGFETIEDVEACLARERAEDEASQAQAQARTQSTHESLLTLCYLFPALDVPAVEAVLGTCGGDYAEAYGILLCSTENITRQDLGNCWNGNIKPADELRLQRVCQMFSSVPKEVVRSTFGAAGGDVAETISALNAMTSDMLSVEVDTASAAPAAVAPTPSAAEALPSYLLRPSATREEIQKFYEEVEDELRMLGDWRRVSEQAYIVNACRIRIMSRATQAYNRGDGKTAKTLSRHGKQLGAEYVRLNRIAMIALERERLAQDSASTLDLHGFHVEEAVEVLRRRVQLCVQKRIRRLTVVVGRGRHSRRGNSAVYPVILNQLQEDPELKSVVEVRSKKPAYFEVDIILRDR
ncbi:uncharacterized protein Tco025E_05848 [Trypanosoma conorhini]|uniref:Uncharacterized protein n=1 Tax=Trypanosoma conorhini TaxID=83891 RepID=A0A3R7LHC6_9TRYP|nr:uncharacterized protein Tco025E_05848 [Trypanosoma conorhini]RNF14443.1 hypothetical protein Tco025E_05848 [Trypanosoma conorhini]